MTFHDDNVAKARTLPRPELERLVVEMWDRADDRRLRKEATDADLRLAEGELSGVEEARLFEMPTVLDDAVRTEGDDGNPVWKHRDEASVKEHHAHHQRMAGLHRKAAGIRDRKDERLGDWADEQGPELDHAGPIGAHLWRDTRCVICGEGYRADDPFERAHLVSVALGGGDGTTEWAHRSCNRAEGIG